LPEPWQSRVRHVPALRQAVARIAGSWPGSDRAKAARSHWRRQVTHHSLVRQPRASAKVALPTGQAWLRKRLTVLQQQTAQSSEPFHRTSRPEVYHQHTKPTRLAWTGRQGVGGT